MAQPASGKLYTGEILGLAVELADYPLEEAHKPLVEVRSRSCGSHIKLGLSHQDGSDRISLGMQVSACAIGQASAAIMASSAVATDIATIALAAKGVEQWVQSAGSRPSWPRIELLEPALAYPARHDAILLPWRAVREALCKADVGG